MGWRFQRHVNTGLGRINISKSGISLSEGFRGAHITIGKTPRITLGIPGSGISWTSTLPRGRRAASTSAQNEEEAHHQAVIELQRPLLYVLLAILGAI